MINLASQIVAFWLLIRFLRTCLAAMRINGPATDAFGWVVASFVMLVIWTAAGRLERMADLIPGFDLYAFLTSYMVVPYGLLSTSIYRLDRELQRHMQRDQEKQP